jgi:peptide/nickel transport system permease protein
MATEKQLQLAAWLQFPRRLILWLLAFTLASKLTFSLCEFLLGAFGWETLGFDWATSLVTIHRPVAEIISERLPNSLWLLAAALLLALALTLLLLPLAAGLHRLAEKPGLPGAALGWLGRLGLFALPTAPVFVVGVLLLSIFVIHLERLPLNPMRHLQATRGPIPELEFLILPALTLALLPAVLAASTIARRFTLPRQQQAHPARLLPGLPQVLVSQAGGLLSALVLVETIFAWPGIGWLLARSIYMRDLPVILGILQTMLALVLAGQLTAELFHWLARLSWLDRPRLPQAPSPSLPRPRFIWLVLALLLIPLALAIAGLFVDPAVTMAFDLQNRNAPPSTEHPWGADQAGRDIQALVLLGTPITLATVTLAALLVLLPAGLWSALTRLLAARRTLWAESLADLLLLPIHTLLLIPALPAALLLHALFTTFAPHPLSIQAGVSALSLIVALILLPRLIHLGHTLLLPSAADHVLSLSKGSVLSLSKEAPRVGVLLLAALFAGFYLVTAMEFLGMGLPPPNASLGGAFSRITLDSTPLSLILAGSPVNLLPAGAIIWAIALAFYMAAEALIALFHHKTGLAPLNE